MHQLYKNIKNLREEKDMSQTQLAELTGYTHRSSITKIEKGEVDLSLSKIEQFAKVFGKEPGELVGWEDETVDDDKMAIWNERIHERRLEKGITLAQIAERLGVTEATAQRYECGNIKSIPYEYMCAYGEILNCSPCYLMGWEDKEESPKIMQYYEQLNDTGKHEATRQVKLLTEVPRYKKGYSEFSEELTPDKDYLLPNAAHADESLTEITEEMVQAEEDIMDNL